MDMDTSPGDAHVRLKTLLLVGAAAYAWKRFSGSRGGGGMRRHQEDELDTALDDTFPASDPPSMTSPTSTTASVRPESMRRGGKISH